MTNSSTLPLVSAKTCFSSNQKIENRLNRKEINDPLLIILIPKVDGNLVNIGYGVFQKLKLVSLVKENLFSCE